MAFWIRNVLVGSIVALAAGCGGSGAAEDGPLSIKADERGALTATAPRGASNAWAMTFAFFPLCTSDGSSVRLSSVTWESQVPAADVAPYFRVVPPRDDRRGKNVEYQPFVERGTPEGGNYSGRFVPAEDGVELDQRCADVHPDLKRVDLALAVTAGDAGAEIDRVVIGYEADGKEYELVLNWSLVLCGSKVTGGDC